jgi:hypothetical protein
MTMNLAVRTCVVLAGMAVCGQQVLARDVPDMTIRRWSYAEHLKEKKAWEVVNDFELRILEAEQNGADASKLRAERQRYWDEHVRPYWEAVEGEELFKLKQELVLPTASEVDQVRVDPDPAKARKLIDALYKDFGRPWLNYTNFGGIVLPVLQELAGRELDDETRRVLVAGVNEFAIKGAEQLVNADELRACDLAQVLYRLAGPDDEEALNTVQLLYGRALARVRATGYKDYEEQIIRSAESTLDTFVNDNEDTVTASGGGSVANDELKAARRDFRMAIRNPVLPERAARILRHLRREWGSARVNSEMERSYMRYGVVLIRVLRWPPPGVSASRLDECRNLFNRGMIELVGHNLGPAGWRSWTAVGIRMQGVASPELLQVISERMQNVASDGEGECALKALKTVQSALRVERVFEGSSGCKPPGAGAAEPATSP